MVSNLACARFGFEDIEPAVDAGLTDGLVVKGSGPAGASGQGPGGAAQQGGAEQGGAEQGGAGQGGSGQGGAAGTAPIAPDAGAPDCADGIRNGDETGVDCGGSRCGPCTCTLGAPERLGDPNYAGNDLWSPKLSSDGLSLYFGVTVPGFKEQLAVSTRSVATDPFGMGQALPAPINDSGEGTPFLALDGLSLYFYSERAGGAGARDLYVATRPSTTDAFDGVTPLATLNTPDLDYQPWLTPDLLTIYFVSGPAGSGDIFRATRGSASADFAPPLRVSELNTPDDEGGVTLSADGLELILTSNRPGGPGARDLFRATRASASEPFSSPEPIPELDTSDNEVDPAFSPDGTELYFSSNRGGGDNALYRSTRSCSR